jgi:hypothetical protein
MSSWTHGAQANDGLACRDATAATFLLVLMTIDNELNLEKRLQYARAHRSQCKMCQDQHWGLPPVSEALATLASLGMDNAIQSLINLTVDVPVFPPEVRRESNKLTQTLN